MQNTGLGWKIGIVGLVALGAMSCGGDTGSAPAPNQPPAIDRLSAQRTTVPPGETTKVQVRVTDPDLSGSSAGGADAGGADAGGDAERSGAAPTRDGLEYAWSVDGSDWKIEGSGATATVTAPKAYERRGTVSVVVRDAQGASDERSITLETGTNRAPQLEEVSVSPNPVAPGGTATLSAKASDADEDEVSYAWTAPEGWSLESTEGAEVQLTAPETEDVAAEVQLEVSDAFGAATTTSVQVQTGANDAPTVASMTATPPQVEPGGTTSVEVQASDPDGDELSYTWSAPMDWSISGQGATAQLTAPDDYGASAKISVRISDAGGEETTSSIVVTTRENAGPRITHLTADPPQVARGGTIQLQVGATDPNGDTLSYSWSAPGASNWQLNGMGASATLQAPDQPGQTAKVQVEVTDASGKTALASRLVGTQNNRGPTLGTVVANPGTLAAGGTSMLRASASDPDGDALSYDWQAPKGWTVSGQGAQVTLQAPDAGGKNAVIGLTVKDGFGGTATGTVAVRTATNRAPSIASVTASPSHLAKGGTATIEVNAADPDGDPLSYTWSVPANWTRKGSGATIQVTAPDKMGVRARIQVTVSDDAGHSVTGTTSLATSPNRPPVIASLGTNRPNWIDRDGRAQLSAQAFDPDGRIVSYAWSAPSGWKVVGQGDRVTLEAPDKSEVSATITLTVTDDTGASVSETLKVRTQDTEPAAFGFPDKSGVAPNAPITSKAVTVQGFEGTVAASCSGCQVSVNGDPFTKTAPAVAPGDAIRLRVQSAAPGKKVTATVTVGDTQSDPWTVESQPWAGERKFTTCGVKKGRKGPSQSNCDSAYNNTTLDGEVNVNGGIQTWTVPVDGTYRIEAAGAEGASTHSNGGGRGARMRGDIKLNAGDTLKIVVGQMGTVHSDTRTGGGGGSFVVLASGNKPLLVAGGGGGMTDNSIDSNNHATTAEDGRNASPGGNDANNYSYGGKNGNGGTKGSGSGGSAGCGGGFKTDGWQGAHTEGQGGGHAFLNGAEGGYNPDQNSQGGFGGGGSGGNHGGGGGGGYSGGGGHWHYPGGGGGGGSYNIGSNQDNQSGTNKGPGWVHIDFVK